MLILIKVNIKNCTCYYFDDIMGVIDIDLNNILLDKYSYKKNIENILVCDISYKTLWVKNHCVFGLIN